MNVSGVFQSNVAAEEFTSGRGSAGLSSGAIFGRDSVQGSTETLLW